LRLSISNTCLDSAVIDNNILVDLYELDHLHILFEVFNTIIIPKSIYDTEITIEVLDELSLFSFQVIDLSEISFETFFLLSNNFKYRNLSIQDKTAISIASEFTCYCGSNDGLIRKACIAFDIRHIGILGIIKYAYYKDIITKRKLISLCDLLVSNETSCYISEHIIKEFINEI
jgi:predicted nucleic acid-binding protein